MKTVSFLLLFCALTWLARAEDARPAAPENLDAIVEQQVATLTKIVDDTNTGYKNGTGSPEDVRQVSLDLYLLRHETAKTLAERLSWQDRIIALEQQRQTETERQLASGTATTHDVLRTEERVLEAKQKRLEIEGNK